MNYYIGVDLGTTAVKVVLFDGMGREAASASRELSLLYPAPGQIEQSPEAWYEIPCALIRQVSAGIPGGQVKGIGVSSQGITLIPTDRNFLPLCDGISWLDTRADAELGWLLARIPEEELFALTGKHPSPVYTLPKLLWMQKNRPEITKRAAYFLLPMDYFYARCTGRAVTDATMAGGTMLYDLQKGEWSERLCALSGTEPEKLPAVLPTGSPVGYMNEETKKLTGLSGDILFAVGAQDQKIAAYGAGIAPGIATVSLGTAGAMEILCDRRSDSLPSFGFRVGTETSYLLEGCVNTFGAAIRWARDTVFPDLSYREMDTLAESTPPGSRGVLFYPHLSGPGTPHFGSCPAAGWRGLSLSSSRGDMLRALYEGLACEIRLNIEAARASGAPVEKLRLFGGASRSDILCRILADVTGVELEAMCFTEIASFGAAKAAAVCCGESGFAGDHGFRHYLPERDSEALYRRYLQGQIY